MPETSEGIYRSARRDVLTAAILLALCGIAAWSLYTNPSIYGFDYAPDPGPGLLPVIVIALLVGCSIALGILGIWRMSTAREGRSTFLSTGLLKEYAYPLAMILSLLIVQYTMIRFGFLAAAIPFALVWCSAIAFQDGMPLTVRNSAVFAVEAVFIAVATQVVFVRLIGVPLN